MAEIVTPPWDLCGFARDSDPWSLDPSPWYRTRRGALDDEPPADPNEWDGRWGELAFLPHELQAVVSFYPGEAEPRVCTVPVYPTVAEALERGERAFI